jgi:2-hydroxymuconate-semialdehyde hydrolase
VTDIAAVEESSTARIIEAGGMPVHFHDVGDGPPLLMIHSFGPMPGTTAWLTFHKVIGPLSTRYRCIAMDMPNYGKTGPITFDEPVHDMIARTAIALMDELGIDQFSALGNSQGATVALDIAMNYPGRVTRIIGGACHASTGGDPYLLQPFPSEVMRLWFAAQTEPADRERVDLLIDALIHDPSQMTVAMRDELFALRTSARAHIEASQASPLVPKSNLATLANIDVPVLIIHGRFDRMVPLEQALMLINYIPSADLVALNNCGHWPPFEQPEEYVSHVLRFLDATSSS